MGASGFILDIFTKCANIVANDPVIDIVIIPLWPDHIYRHVFKRMIAIRDSISKPFAFCLPNISDDNDLAKRFNSSKKLLHKNRVLYFFSLRNAAKSISSLCDYVEFKESRGLPIMKPIN